MQIYANDLINMQMTYLICKLYANGIINMQIYANDLINMQIN